MSITRKVGLAALIGALAGAVALGGCKKKEDEAGKKADKKQVEHGKVQGDGKGGGPKDATGAKTGTPGTAKTVQHGKVEGKGSGGGAKDATGAKTGTPGSVDPAIVERGAYLAAMGGCVGCHTPMGPQGPMMDKAFAGGMEVKEELVTWRSPNITPHPETGIGKWTDEQIIAAIRDGARPDGTTLHPIMPWPYYRNLTDADARAMVAFLRHGVKPVDHKVERLEMPALTMQLPPPDRSGYGDDQLKRGKYFADLMHCAMCHTPMTAKGPDMSKLYAGGFKMELPPAFGTGVLYSSNLTSDKATGIGNWTEQQIIDSVTKGVRPDGKPIFGPMMFYLPLWSQMKPDDAAALGAFIKSLPPIKHKVPASTFKPAGPPPGK